VKTSAEVSKDTVKVVDEVPEANKEPIKTAEQL
jgi:hypothetical protein